MVIKARVEHDREFSENSGGYGHSLAVPQQSNHPLKVSDIADAQ